MRYSESVIEQIKSKLRLSEVVGSYIGLKRQGSSEDYKACCPFHNEKTPSFVVHDDKGFYKCFGCQKSGNMFTFVMEMEHLSFPEAIEELAKRANIELKPETEHDKIAYNRQKALGEMYNRLCNSYHHILLHDKSAQRAREYIAKRGISEETCDKFMLGYAFDDPNWLYTLLSKNNYSDDLIKASGLFSKNYEKLPLFRNRILFPIRTWQGNCVGFSGRDLTGESKAKYINTPETSLYSKRSLLFGFFESLPELKKREEIILCEGNFDVISLHQAGICYACAPLGTAFTSEQVQLIKRYCTKVNLLFDADEAGRNATIKAILLCQKNNLECHVIEPFQNAKDASQVLEEYGTQTLAKLILKTEPAFSYLVNSAEKLYNAKSPKGKLSLFKEVIPYLDATSSEIERQGYVKQLSEILGVEEEKILRDYRQQQFKTDANDSENMTNDSRKIAETSELYALILLVNNRDKFGYFKRRIKINDIADKNARMLYTVLEDCERDEAVSDESVLLRIEDETLRNYVAETFSDGLHKLQNADMQAIDEAIKPIRYKNLVEKRRVIIDLIESGETDNPNRDEYIDLLDAKKVLDEEIRKLRLNEED